MKNTLIIGYDGTEGAKQALTEGIKLAKDLGSKVVIGFSYEVSPLGGEMQDFREAVKELGERALEEIDPQLKQSGLEIEKDLIEARAAEGLVQLAQDHDARMIVVGCYGEKPLTGALLGSTAHKLLSLAEIPVVVVQA